VHAKTSAKKPVAPETAASGVADAPAARPTNAVSTTFRTGSSASATSDGAAIAKIRASRFGGASGAGSGAAAATRP